MRVENTDAELKIFEKWNKNVQQKRNGLLTNYPPNLILHFENHFGNALSSKFLSIVDKFPPM